jgi:hypothetical protein
MCLCYRHDVAALRGARRNARRRPWRVRRLLIVGALAILATRGAASAQPVCPETDLDSTLPASVSGTTVGAPSARTGTCGGDGPEATFLFTAPMGGTYLIDTRGSNVDTVLYVRNATCEGAELACNDDFEGTSSQVIVELTAAQPIVVVVDSLNDGGDFTLNIAPVDATPPVLTALSFPSMLNLSTDPAAVTVSYSATDDASGVAFFSMLFAIPNVGCGVGSFDSDFPPALSRTAEVDIDLPENRPGLYLVCEVFLCDAQDNCRTYVGDDLTALGFPTELSVVNEPPTPNTPTPEPTGSGTTPPTPTPTGQPTASATTTPTPTATAPPTGSATSPPTPTPGAQPTASATTTSTPTATAPPTGSATSPPTPTPSAQPTASATTTSTPTATAQPTGSATSPPTPSTTAQPTASATGTSTPTAIAQPTGSATRTPTPTATAQPTGSATNPRTPTPSDTPTGTATGTPSVTPTRTGTPATSETVSPTATATPSPTEAQTPEPVCAGDCAGNGEVTVDEIIILVNIALGSTGPSACPHGVPDGRAVDITLIVQSVGYALTTCPA